MKKRRIFARMEKIEQIDPHSYFAKSQLDLVHVTQVSEGVITMTSPVKQNLYLLLGFANSHSRKDVVSRG